MGKNLLEYINNCTAWNAFSGDAPERPLKPGDVLPIEVIKYSKWSIGTLHCDAKTGELIVSNAWYRRALARVHLFLIRFIG